MAKGKELLGLDVGTNSIKMVEIKDTKQGYFLSKFGIAPLPRGAFSEGEIADMEGVVGVISRLHKELKFKTKEVASCISSRSVIIKKINLPAMSEFELEDQIGFEAEQHVPFDIKEVYLDYQPLGSATPEGEQMDVLLVAAKKDYVDRHRELLKASGLICSVVDVDVFALENIYEVNYPYAEHEVVALVDVGASIMKVNILVEGVTAFNRDVVFGGNGITEEIERRWNLSFEEAEALKTGAQVGGVDQEDVKRFLFEQGLAMAGEVENSFEFFLATPFGRPVTKIYLSGGGARLADFSEVLRDRTGIEAEILNPFQQIGWDSTLYSPEYLGEVASLISVGAGLALRRTKER